MEIREYLREERVRVDAALDRLLPREHSRPSIIHQAIRHSVFAGGKRIRPILVLATGEAFGSDSDELLRAAASVELIHTYSLIHDDLPAMDNSDLRRGKPSCHKAFGEAIAILAGDALLTQAFELTGGLANGMVTVELGKACGTFGLVGGQVVDLEYENRRGDLKTLEYIHFHKTAALIRASIQIGGLVSNADETSLKALDEYGRHLGLTFQIVDDILDVEGDTSEIGKQTGEDAAAGKMTYPALLGMTRSKKEADRRYQAALEALQSLEAETTRLKEIASVVRHRRL